MKKHWIVKSEPLAGASTTNIWRLLFYNRFRIHPKYWLRLTYAMVLSSVTFILRLVERLRFNKKIKNSQLQKDPIFIIGFWRSGTTYLNYIMALDKGKSYVSNIEVYAPHFFLAFPKFTRNLIVSSLPETRPMDEVKINADLPGEEEHAMGAYDKYGFFHTMIFPSNFQKFSKFLLFDTTPERDERRWKKRYHFFLRKVSYKYGGRQIVLKNPANTFRLKQLHEMYPNAKYIHLYRNPYEVFKSNLKFHNDTNEIFALQTWDMEEVKENVFGIYRELYEKFDEIKKDIPKENIIDIQYEKFIKEPYKTVERIYKELDIDGFDEAKDDFKKFIDDQKEYLPRIYNFSEEEIKRVNDNLDVVFKRFGYEKK